jgi:hypothetical protein
VHSFANKRVEKFSKQEVRISQTVINIATESINDVNDTSKKQQ